jgi:hypothetical protein
MDSTPQKWDDKDFFIMRDTFSTYITEKAYNCLKGKVSNIEFITYEDHIEQIKRLRQMMS